MKQSQYYTLLIHHIKTSPIGNHFSEASIEHTISSYLNIITLSKEEFEALYYLLKDTTMIYSRNNIGYIISEYQLNLTFQKLFSSILISLLLNKKTKHDFDNVCIAQIEIFRSSTENNLDQQITQFKTAMREHLSYEVTKRLSHKNSARFFVTPSLKNLTPSLIKSYDATVEKLMELDISMKAFDDLEILVAEIDQHLGVFAPISECIVLSPQKKGEHRVTLFHEALHRLIHHHANPELRSEILYNAKQTIELAQETSIIEHYYWCTIIDDRYPEHKIGEETLVRLIQASSWEPNELNANFKLLPISLKCIIAHLFNLAQKIVQTASVESDIKPTLFPWYKKTIREHSGKRDSMAEAFRVGSICRNAIRGLSRAD